MSRRESGLPRGRARRCWSLRERVAVRALAVRVALLRAAARASLPQIDYRRGRRRSRQNQQSLHRLIRPLAQPNFRKTRRHEERAHRKPQNRPRTRRKAHQAGERSARLHAIGPQFFQTCVVALRRVRERANLCLSVVAALVHAAARALAHSWRTDAVQRACWGESDAPSPVRPPSPAQLCDHPLKADSMPLFESPVVVQPTHPQACRRMAEACAFAAMAHRPRLAQ
mmetsp:Transcript_14645/g.39209  ORF Transcript_14645/g.39209 Transcript_14645/m.39209 type:complete len:227 (-) Transcript_14645:1267-1947(-)